MIETTQTVTIAAPIAATWSYARDVPRWAEIMPGYQSCEIVDADHSQWLLKVGVGGLVRTVRVAVHVTRWAGPEDVEFTFALQGDPVEGSGSYHARPTPAGDTEVDLTVQVRGSGPMAPMWEAMGAPVLPRFARSFAEELKGRIEGQARAKVPAGAETTARQPPPAVRSSWVSRLIEWVRGLLGR